MREPEGAGPKLSADEVALHRMVGGFRASSALHLITKLGIPDRLAGGPRSAAELAAEIGAHAPSLERLMRWLVALGVFEWDEEHRFALSGVSQLLRSDHPGPGRWHALFLGAPYVQEAWAQLEHSVRTGESGFRRAHGVGQYEYYESHPERGRHFEEMLAALRPARHAELARCYDFSGIHTLVDVGGGFGQGLAAVLQAHPHVRGILFDVPEVVAKAAPRFAGSELEARCELVGGDFFDAVPKDADLYLLGDVLHNWGDEESRAILGACRRAMPSAGRLLIVEDLMPAGTPSPLVAEMDAMMLVFYGEARQRTEAEFRDLFEGAGLALESFRPGWPVGWVEARPV